MTCLDNPKAPVTARRAAVGMARTVIVSPGNRNGRRMDSIHVGPRVRHRCINSASRLARLTFIVFPYSRAILVRFHSDIGPFRGGILK